MDTSEILWATIPPGAISIVTIVLFAAAMRRASKVAGKSRILVGGFAAVMFIATVAAWYDAYREYSVTLKRDTLARELKVDLSKVRWPDAFPAGYFAEALKRGMVRKEVHKIVIGYDKVETCGAIGERYYYSSDFRSLRIAILYDKDGRYVRMDAEDADETLPSAGCVEGR